MRNTAVTCLLLSVLNVACGTPRYAGYYYVEDRDDPSEPARFLVTHPSRPTAHYYRITYSTDARDFYINGEPVSEDDLASLGFRIVDAPDEDDLAPPVPGPALSANPQPWGDAEFRYMVRATLGLEDSDGVKFITGTDYLQVLNNMGCPLRVGNHWRWDGYYYNSEGDQEWLINNDGLFWFDKTVANAAAGFQQEMLAEGWPYTALLILAGSRWGDTSSEVVNLMTARKPIVVAEAARVTSMAAQGYINFVTMVVPGSDAVEIVLAVADLMDGKVISAAMGLAPYAGKGLVAAGEVVVHFGPYVAARIPRSGARLFRKLDTLMVDGQLAVLTKVQQLVPFIGECGDQDMLMRGLLGRIFCVAEDTLVLTADGLLPVQDITAGTRLQAYNEANKSFCFQPVARPPAHESCDLLKIRFVGRYSEHVTCTSTHPFYARSEPNGGFRWCEARDLCTGMEVFSAGAPLVTVDQVTRVDTPTTVYSVFVPGEHTFLVGKNAVLTHNGTECYLDDLRQAKNLSTSVGNVYDYLKLDGDWLRHADGAAMSFEEALDYMQCYVARVAGRANPNKAALKRHLRRVAPSWGSGTGWHEFLPVNRIEKIILTAEHPRAFREVLDLMRDARTQTRGLIFPAKGIDGFDAVTGKWFGHSGAGSEITTRLWQAIFHADLNRAFDEAWAAYKASGADAFDRALWWRKVRLVMHDYFTEATGSPIVQRIGGALGLDTGWSP